MLIIILQKWRRPYKGGWTIIKANFKHFRRKNKAIYMKSLFLAVFLPLVLSFSFAQAKETITFLSKDGLQITADSYIADAGGNRSLIVLFHQAGWSRGEYIEIAPRLNKLGFDVLAVDLRSGKAVNSVTNETAKRARKAGKGTRYIDALPDMEAALLYARKGVEDGVEVIAWGSSYSSALVLQLVGEKPALADAVLSFSPGEYFRKSGKPRDWIQKSAASINVPVFITSAKSERGRWSAIFKGIKSKNKVGFTPKTKGNHGSRALWDKFSDSKEYWLAITQFLESMKSIR
jgi:dienelactone hydrolase